MISIIKAGILTASERAAGGKKPDIPGTLLRTLLEKLPAEVVAYRVVGHDKNLLKNTLIQMCDLLRCHLILTSGGTGLSPHDIVPEATREVIEREIPGISEMIRMSGLSKAPQAILSRAVAGIRRQCLIINLPESPSAVEEAFVSLEPILLPALALIRGEAVGYAYS